MGENDVEILIAARADLAAAQAAVQQFATDLNTTMGRVQDSLGRITQNAQGALGDNPTGLVGLLGRVQEVGARMVGPTGFLMQLGEGFQRLTAPMDLFHSSALKLMEVMAGWRLMEGGIQAVTGFASQIFSLPISGQYQEMAWKYQYGGGAKGAAAAQDVMGWTFGESLNVPYTRQDMMAAISILNTMQLSPAGIKQYLPTLADVAAAAGTNQYGQPVTLQMAAMSVMGASMGISRMLKYDLHIEPEQLVQYGYDPNNPTTLLPALQKYDVATGRVGAAGELAHATFRGEWTSVVDRFQNMAIQTGGMTMTGQVDPKGPLQALMDFLNKFTSFTDAKDPKTGLVNIKQGFLDIASTVGHDIADAMRLGETAVESFLKALQAVVGTGLLEEIKRSGDWLTSSDTVDHVKAMASTIGTDLGQAFQMAGGWLHQFGSWLNAISPQQFNTIVTGLMTIAQIKAIRIEIDMVLIEHALLLIGDLAKALQDLKSGNLKGVGQDLYQALKDLTPTDADKALWQQWMQGQATYTEHTFTHQLHHHAGQQGAHASAQGFMDGILAEVPQIRQYGRDVVTHLLHGVDMEAHTVERSAQRLISTWTTALEKEFSKIAGDIAKNFGATLRQAGKFSVFGATGSIFG